jgi:hypothetical protein
MARNWPLRVLRMEELAVSVHGRGSVVADPHPAQAEATSGQPGNARRHMIGQLYHFLQHGQCFDESAAFPAVVKDTAQAA